MRKPKFRSILPRLRSWQTALGPLRSQDAAPTLRTPHLNASEQTLKGDSQPPSPGAGGVRAGGPGAGSWDWGETAGRKSALPEPAPLNLPPPPQAVPPPRPTGVRRSEPGRAEGGRTSALLVDCKQLE